MKKFIIIGLILLVVGIIIYFIVKKVRTGSFTSSTNSDGSNFFNTSGGSSKSYPDLELNSYGKVRTVPAAYGADNVVTHLISDAGGVYVNGAIAMEAYANDFASAISQASGETFNTTNRTTAYNMLKEKPYWKSLMQKIQADPRLDQNIKDEITEVLRITAWDGILATAASASKKDKINKAVQAATKYAPLLLAAL